MGSDHDKVLDSREQAHTRDDRSGLAADFWHDFRLAGDANNIGALESEVKEDDSATTVIDQMVDFSW